MSLGVGAGIGIGIDDSEVKGNVFTGAKINSTKNSSLQYVSPNGQTSWQNNHTDGAMVALADGIFLKFGFKWSTKSTGSSQSGIAINGVKQSASELIFGGSDTAYKEKTKAELSGISFSKGDLISIYGDGTNQTTDRGGFGLVVQYGAEPQTNNQIISETVKQTMTTVFNRLNYRNNTQQTLFQNVSQVQSLPGFHKRYFIHIHTAPTLGDTVIITRRTGQSLSMPGTVNQTMTDAESDNTIVEISAEQDIPFLESDDLNIGFIRIGSAGVAPVFSFIIIWEYTLP